MTRVRWALGGLVLLALGCLLVFIGPTVMAMTLGALVVMALIPGVLLAALLCAQARELDWIEFGVVSAGLGVVFLVLGTYGLHIIPGPLTRGMILSAYAGANIILLAALVAANRLPELTRSAWTRNQLLVLVAIFVVACALRLPMVGYSEFQGDEGRAALRAAEVLQGYDEVLFLHKKGPVEIILPAALYGATGHLTEATARLPLALANIAFLVALAYLGRRLLSPWAGLMASAILTVDGFVVGFSRLLQYQSVILLTTTLVLLLLARATERESLDRGLVWGAALLAASGLLAHYEGIFSFGGALWLLWRWARRWDKSLGQVVGSLALPVISGAALVGLFYVPFVLHPQFAETSVYLADRRVGHGLFYSNLADFFQRAGFYSSTYYVIGLAAVLAAGCGVLLQKRYRDKKVLWWMLALVPLWILALGWPTLWVVWGVNLTVLLYGATMALVWFAWIEDGPRTVLIWFGAPALLYFFMMTKVHTHYYVTLPAWTLMVGYICSRGWEMLHARGGARRMLLGVGLVWWILCLGYISIAFLRTAPEWMLSYPMSKPALYWSPYEQPPAGGYFGFPYHTAWKAIGAMYADGTLSGTYDSNQEDLITNWYTRGELRVKGSSQYIMARQANPNDVPYEILDGTFMPMIEVTRGGVGQLWVFREGYQGEMTRVAAEALERTFDRELSVPVFHVGAPLDDRFLPENTIDARMGEAVALAGWTLDSKVVAPGEDALLTLYWRSVEETNAGYNVFASLGDGDPVAIVDAVPQGGENPTFRWTPGQEIVDRHMLQVSADAADGVYPLRLGMVDYVTRDRLAVYDGQGNDIGSTLHLTDVRIGVPLLVDALPDQRDCAAFGESVLLAPVPNLRLTSAPGDTIEVAVTWYAAAQVHKDLTVFVQCLGPDGKPYGQIDTKPRGGSLPTSLWQASERIDDQYVVKLHDEAPPGAFRIALGLYDPATGVRESVALYGDSQPDGMLVIGEMEVE